MYGYYIKMFEYINGRNTYTSENYQGNFAIWWCGKEWRIGPKRTIGQCLSYAKSTHESECLLNYTGWEDWNIYYGINEGWKPAGKGLGLRCVLSSSRFSDIGKIKNTTTEKRLITTPIQGKFRWYFKKLGKLKFCICQIDQGISIL